MRNALKSCKLICGWGKKGVHEMCDFSLRAVKSRPAKIGDKLTTRGFGTGTRGFAASEDANVAVCLLPGTELSFEQEVTFGRSWWLSKPSKFKTAIFRQVNQHDPRTHHDALEFPRWPDHPADAHARRNTRDSSAAACDFGDGQGSGASGLRLIGRNKGPRSIRHRGPQSRYHLLGGRLTATFFLAVCLPYEA